MASVWVSTLVSSDTNHALSQRWIDSVIDREETIAEPVVLLAEIAGAVARHTNDEQQAIQGIALVQRIPNLRIVPIDLDLADLAAEIAARLRLPGTDALYTALAQRLGLALITWDIQQRSRSRAVVDAFTPQEALDQPLQ